MVSKVSRIVLNGSEFNDMKVEEVFSIERIHNSKYSDDRLRILATKLTIIAISTHYFIRCSRVAIALLQDE